MDQDQYQQMGRLMPPPVLTNHNPSPCNKEGKKGKGGRGQIYIRQYQHNQLMDVGLLCIYM